MGLTERFIESENEHGHEHSFPRAPDRERHEEKSQPVRVLVAEDKSEMRTLITNRLRKEGYEVIEAEDGPDLMSQLAASPLTQRPDVIVSDVRMPGFSGLEVLAHLRLVDRTTPVILITAFGDERLHAEADRLGAAIVLDKPFDLDDLVYAVFAFAEL